MGRGTVGRWDVERWTVGRRWTLDAGNWKLLVVGLWTFACWTLDVERESLDVLMLDVGVRCTLNTLDVGTFGRSDVQTFRRWTLDV